MIGGVFWIATTKGLGQVITWAITIFVIRLLDPSDYGLMGMATLFIGFLLLFNEFGLGAAIVQNGGLDDEHIWSLRWAILLINLVLFAFVLAGAPTAAAYFREPALVPILRLLGTAFVINGIGAPSMYLLQRSMAFRRKSQAEVAGHLAGGILTVALAASGFGVWSLVSGYLASQLTTNTLYCVYRPIRLGGSPSLRRITGLLKFGVQIAFARVLWYASSNADFLIVGRVLGTVQLGFYSLAFQLSSMPIDKIVGIVTQVAFPSFCAVQTDDERLRRYFVKLVGSIALVTFPMFLGLYSVAGDLVAVLFTEKWVAVIVPFQTLCVIACLRAIDTLNSPLVIAKGRPDIILANNLVRALLMPLAFYIGTRGGLEGVAIAWLAGWPPVFVVLTWPTLRLIGLRVTAYLDALKHALIGSLVMVAIIKSAQALAHGGAPTATRLVLTCALGATAYAAYQLAFNWNTVREPLALVWRRVGGNRTETSSGRPDWTAPLLLRIKTWSGRAGF